jgi:anti-sigma factor RsiW
MNADHDAIAHEEAVGLLDALRDGELEPAEAARVEAHVRDCERCRTVEALLGGGLRAAVTTGAAEDVPDLLPGVQRRLRLRSRGRYYGQARRATGPSSWALVIASLAILLALAASYALLGHVAGPGPAPDPPQGP